MSKQLPAVTQFNIITAYEAILNGESAHLGMMYDTRTRKNPLALAKGANPSNPALYDTNNDFLQQHVIIQQNDEGQLEAYVEKYVESLDEDGLDSYVEAAETLYLTEMPTNVIELDHHVKFVAKMCELNPNRIIRYADYDTREDTVQEDYYIADTN